MPGFKGRAIIYPGLLIAGWVVGRSISLSAEPAVPDHNLPQHRTVQRADNSIVTAKLACPLLLPVWGSTSPPGKIRVLPTMRRKPSIASPIPAVAISALVLPQPANSFRLMVAAQPVAANASTFTITRADNSAAPPAAKAKRLQLYGYGFWRQGAAPASLAPNAQYGGSQYGAIATWDPIGAAGRGPALLLRGSGTPDGLQREIAIGTRWQPSHHLPLSLSLERRFRANAADSLAAYVAGGIDRVPLIGKLALDAYGQAGYSLGGASSPFADAHARVQHPLAKPLGIPIRIGAGAWVGGQKGAFRGDIGPTLSAQIDSRFADFTLQLDWRKRVVGNAAPADGMAVTVSTGF